MKIIPANDTENKKILDALHKLEFAYTKIDNYYMVVCRDQELFDKVKQHIQNATDAQAEYTTM